MKNRYYLSVNEQGELINFHGTVMIGVTDIKDPEAKPSENIALFGITKRKK